jgi:hypothetical protein
MLDRAVVALKAWLVHPRLPGRLALLAVVLTLPALWIGWRFDDHLHRLMMLGHAEVETHPLEVFSSFRGDPEILRDYVDTGLFPWWTPPAYRLAFFRYLSAVSMWIDYQVWPDAPALMHLHSLAWYAALVAVATLLYRRLLGVSWWAGLAALLYAVDDAHVTPAAWLANRNALLAVLFGILCLWSFDRWRRDGSTRDAALSPIFLGLGLCSGEMAVAALGYLLAYALFLDRAAWRSRLAAVIPHAMVVIAWATVYRTMDFGTHGSDFYQDPIGRPTAFLGAFFARAPVLLLGQWSPIPADWAMLFPDAAFWSFWTAGVAVIVLGTVFLTPLIRRSRTARFWAVGMTCSLVPIAAVAPANRLLLFVGLGAMGLVAEFVRGVLEGADWMPTRRLWRLSEQAAVVLLALTHLVVAPMVSPFLAYSLKPLGDPMVRAIASVPDDPRIAGQDLVLVNPPDYLFLATSIGTLKILEGKPYPRRLRVLVAGTSPVEVTRLDESSLRVRTEESIYGGVLGRLFRSRYDPMRPGQRFELTGMTVQIARTDAEGNPVEFVHTFSVPLENPSLRWLQWEQDGYVPFVPPSIGNSVTLSASYGPFDVVRRNWRGTGTP